MRGGILKDGRLFIKRNGVEKTVDCRFCTSVTHVNVKDTSGSLNPHDVSETYRRGFGCSDHCSHFGEPTKIKSVNSDTVQTQLKLCHGKVLEFDDFTDARSTALELDEGNKNG